MLWSLPMLASGLLALLRWGFGSLFLVGERLAEALLRTASAPVAGTLARLHADPVASALESAAGVVLAAAAAPTVFRQAPLAGLLAAASAAEAWWFGLQVTALLLLSAAMLAFVTTRA